MANRDILHRRFAGYVLVSYYESSIGLTAVMTEWRVRC
jgi:hypothetical protein